MATCEPRSLTSELIGVNPSVRCLARQRAPGPATILVVDDEPVVRRVMARILTKRGYHVLSASDGKEALHISQSYVGDVVLLVTDVVMAKLGGVELQLRLSKERPGLKTLFVSGHACDAIEQRSLAGEQVAFLAKPFTPSGLVNSVRLLLEGVGK